MTARILSGKALEGEEIFGEKEGDENVEGRTFGLLRVFDTKAETPGYALNAVRQAVSNIRKQREG